MKSKFLLLALLACSNTLMVKANKWNVSVANFQFSPANINVLVGDTIVWNWVSGSHTTTSTSLPAGAASWDSPMNISATTFEYKVTVAGSYNYWCTIHAPNMAGTITASAVLPVSLTGFTVGKGNNAGSALLKWSTTSEENTASFVVKKSVDGSAFNEISRVKAAGNSSVVKNYSFTDNNTGSVNKYLYYELQLINKDGSSALTPVKKYINPVAAKKLIIQLSPNPVSAQGHLMLRFNADKQEEMKVELYDINGKLVQQETMYAQEGINNGHMHLGNIVPGIYNIVFSLDDLKESYKIIVDP